MKITQAVVLPVREKKSEKAPDFRITAKVGEKWEEIGAAWKKVGDKGAYLSVKFGDHVTVDVGEAKAWSPKPKADPVEAKKASDEYDAFGGHLSQSTSTPF